MNRKPIAARVRAFFLGLAAALALGSTALSPIAGPAALVALPAALMAGDAGAAISFSTTLRNNRCGQIVTAAGASAKIKLYNGTRPSGVGAVTGGNTLLATGTFGSTIGTCTSGALDWDEAGMTQSNGSHVSGTPTFADITTSADAVTVRVDICGSAPCWTFTGTVTTGQNITLTTLAFTEGNT